MKKVLKRGTMLLLVFILIALAVCASITGNGDRVFAAANESSAEEMFEPKIDIPIDLNSEFREDSIIVAFDKYASGVNKQHDPSVFGNFPKKTVTDLSYIAGDVAKKEYLNKDEFRQMFRIELPVASKENVLAAIEEAKKMKGVLWAKPDYTEDISIPANTILTTGRILDQNYWGVGEDCGIYAEKAWDLLEESSSDKKTIRIAVIDSGIAEHNDLEGKVESGYDFCNKNNITTDDPIGHGTHVAGIIAASGEAIGVYENVSLVPLQVGRFENGTFIFDSTAIVQAIHYAISENIPIINFSGEGPDYYAEEQLAINNYDGLFITAAGNGFLDEETDSYVGRDIDIGSGYKRYPAGYISENIIAVGGMDSDGERVGTSNYGARSIDIFAPGEFIKSTYPYNLSEDGYKFLSGTSMATPFVTGVAAMLLSYDDTLTPAEVKDAILSSAIVTSGLDGLCLTGGRLNAYQAVKYIIEGQKDTYTIYFEAGQTSFDRPVSGSSRNKVYTHGVPESLNFGDTFFIDGYELVGWSTKEAQFILGIGTNTEPEYLVDMVVGGVTFDESITLYAVWRPVTWEIAVETDGSMDSLQIHSLTVDGASLTFTAEAVEGREFIEWRKYYDNSSYTVYSTSQTITVDPNELLSEPYPTRSPVFFLIAHYRQLEEQPETCVAEGTLITLADGSQKAVEDLTGEEQLLVWNMYTGTYDAAPVIFIDSDPAAVYEVIRLTFSDGSTVEVISEHGFFDVGLNEYVYLDADAAEYIGHSFLKQGTDGMTEVTLVGVEIASEERAAYSPVTYGHLCYFVNGMLSMPGGIEGLFNIFEVDAETLAYDEAQMQADIEEYGLYTYEELNVLCPVSEELFEAVNGEYLKIAVGKGLITVEEICALAAQYSGMLA